MSAPAFHHAAEALAFLRGQGMAVWVDRDRLRYRSMGALPLDLRAILVAWRVPLLGFLMDTELEALCAGADPEDAAYLRQERAAILEHQAGLPRDQAERQAGLKADEGCPP